MSDTDSAKSEIIVPGYSDVPWAGESPPHIVIVDDPWIGTLVKKTFTNDGGIDMYGIVTHKWSSLQGETDLWNVSYFHSYEDEYYEYKHILEHQRDYVIDKTIKKLTDNGKPYI